LGEAEEAFFKRESLDTLREEGEKKRQSCQGDWKRSKLSEEFL